MPPRVNLEGGCAADDAVLLEQARHGSAGRATRQIDENTFRGKFAVGPLDADPKPGRGAGSREHQDKNDGHQESQLSYASLLRSLCGRLAALIYLDALFRWWLPLQILLQDHRSSYGVHGKFGFHRLAFLVCAIRVVAKNSTALFFE